MDLAERFSSIIQKKAPLGERTSFRVGGGVGFQSKAESMMQLADLIAAARLEQILWWIFGGGSNLLILYDGVRGLVIEL